MYKCVYGINPPYLNELFTSKDTRYILRDSNRLQQPEFETDMVLGHSATMDQNYGTSSQHIWRRLKIYTTLWKILLNGAYRVNAMCSSYNDIHDVFPSIWNLLHYLIGFILQ